MLKQLQFQYVVIKETVVTVNSFFDSYDALREIQPCVRNIHLSIPMSKETKRNCL